MRASRREPGFCRCCQLYRVLEKNLSPRYLLCSASHLDQKEKRQPVFISALPPGGRGADAVASSWRPAASHDPSGSQPCVSPSQVRGAGPGATQRRRGRERPPHLRLRVVTPLGAVGL